MAKDGTNRGGARPGAGRKKKPLAEHIEAGTRATVMQPPNIPELTGTEMPKVKDYLIGVCQKFCIFRFTVIIITVKTKYNFGLICFIFYIFYLIPPQRSAGGSLHILLT